MLCFRIDSFKSTLLVAAAAFSCGCAGSPPPAAPPEATVEVTPPAPPASATATATAAPALPPVRPPRAVVKIDAHGYDATCALLAGGAVQCIRGGDPYEIPGLASAVDIAVGGGFGCAVTKEGKVLCWGHNHHGQLGVRSEGTSASSYRGAEPVPGVEDATAVAAAEEHACALLRDKTVTCWGGNRNGQLGRADRGDAMPPARVPALDGVAELALTYFNTCARTDAGKVECTTDTPRSFLELSPLRGARRLVAGKGDLCAILGDDSLRCWIGRPKGSIVEFKGRPIAGIPKARRVSVDEEDGHGCAIGMDGQVLCWGHNLAGELGVCTKEKGGVDASEKPVVVEAARGAIDVVAAHHKSCALMGDGTVRCWGYNKLGELGNGLRWVGKSTAVMPTVFDAPSAPLCVSSGTRYDGRVDAVAWAPGAVTVRTLSYGEGQRAACFTVDLAAGTSAAAPCPATLPAAQAQQSWTASDGTAIVYGQDHALARMAPGDKKPAARVGLVMESSLTGEVRGEELVLITMKSEPTRLGPPGSGAIDPAVGDVLVLDAKTLAVKRHIRPPLCVSPAPMPTRCR